MENSKIQLYSESALLQEAGQSLLKGTVKLLRISSHRIVSSNSDQFTSLDLDEQKEYEKRTEEIIFHISAIQSIIDRLIYFELSSHD